MVSHSTRVVGNLLEMATTPVIDIDTASHAPSLLQDQATKMAELELEDDEIRKHLYKVHTATSHTHTRVDYLLVSRA